MPDGRGEHKLIIISVIGTVTIISISRLVFFFFAPKDFELFDFPIV
jgi:hypothetical protein